MGDVRHFAPPVTILDDRYRIERVIGTGAFGRVYLGFDTRLRRNVAIKELLAARDTTDHATYRQYVERFDREARAAAILQHPNIVTVYELAVDRDETIYLLMEYVDGTNLRDLLAQVGPLPVERAVTISLEIGRALVAVHEQDIVHRDLKPANVMLTRRGVTKLTDFGVAQVGHESQRTQSAARHPGTPLYMSPEQASGRGYLDGRSDLYSMGLILYEMLAGESYGRTRRPLNVARPDLSSPLVTIVNTLIARDADERYGDAGAVVAAIEEFARAHPRIVSAVEKRASPADVRPPALGAGGPTRYGGSASELSVPTPERRTLPSHPGTAVPPTSGSALPMSPASPLARPAEMGKGWRWMTWGAGGLVALVVAVSLFALAGHGGTPTVSVGGSTTIGASRQTGLMTTWTDPQGRVRLQYPSTWTVSVDTSQPDNVLTLISADGAGFYLAIRDPLPTLDQEVQKDRDFRAAQAKFTAVVDTVMDLRIGGEPAKVLLITYTSKDTSVAPSATGKDWLVNHGGKEYAFAASPIGTHNAELEAIINSVTFLP